MMHHSRRTFQRGTLVVVFVTIAIIAQAQEMWGIATSNFAGSSGIMLNPCAISTSKLYMDINILTADVFFENNYAYIHNEDYSLFKYIGKSPQFPEYGPDSLPVDHYDGTNDKYIYSSQLVIGPSFMLAYGRHAFAFHTGARAITSAHGIPYAMANFGYYGLDYAPQHNVDYHNQNFGVSSLVMAEVGLTYSFSFRKISNQDWTAGFTIKRMFSPAGGYSYANDINYIVVNDSTINIKNLNAEMGYSLPADYDTPLDDPVNGFPVWDPPIKGGGFGFDVGFTFQNKVLSYQKKRVSRMCSQRYIDYYYKIGVSLLDIGFVNFNKNAQLQSFEDVSEYWIGIDTLNFYTFNQLRRTLSDVFYGDPEASNVADEFRIFLPAAFSIQGDYRISKKFYAAAVIIQPFPISRSYIRRPAQIVLVPRYESPKMEFALPLSLYDYKYPRIGASARYQIITLGTDDLLGLLGITDFTGLDFYFSLKINFRKGNCGRYKRNVPCENEEYGIRHR